MPSAAHLWWRFRFWLWKLGWRLTLRWSQWLTVHNLRVGFYDWDGILDLDQSLILQKTGAAVGLVARFDRRRLDRIRRDLDYVLIMRSPYATGYYLADLNMCVVDSRFVADPDTTPALIACCIVHEATHARLSKAGIRYGEALRSRIEAICTSASAAFARRLPDGESLAAHLESFLSHAPDNWTNVNLENRMKRARYQLLEELPAPAWLKRLLWKTMG